MDGFAETLAAGDAAVWRHLLTTHRARRDGRCSACSTDTGTSRPLWPCRLAVVAAAAQRLAEEANR